MAQTIAVLDFGSQLTQVIARRIRECQVYSKIYHFATPAAKLRAEGVVGIILSGGPQSVYAKTAPHPDPEIFELGVPVLGICYGSQLMSYFLGGEVAHSKAREYGHGHLTVRKPGKLFAGLRMTPFIITLGTLGVARGTAKWLADNQTVNYDTSAINGWMTTADPFSHALPAGVWVAVVLAVLTALLMRKTVFGRHVFALGSNEATARLCGIATTRLKVLIYVLAGCFFGLAGLFQLSRLRQGDPTVAVGLELDIIASVIIGGASLNGGVGTILGSMIGALIMAVLRNGSQQMGWPTYFQEIIIGLVIIVAVFLDRLRQGRAAT